jgi:hypothetical protein
VIHEILFIPANVLPSMVGTKMASGFVTDVRAALLRGCVNKLSRIWLHLRWRRLGAGRRSVVSAVRGLTRRPQRVLMEGRPRRAARQQGAVFMGWEQGWRVKGVPEERRYASAEEAIKAARRVRRMIPNRTKGKKETGGRRPNHITAERIHHSRGKLFEQFLEEMGFDKLSDTDKLRLMDSFKLGGQELFAKWKQRRYEGWVPVKTVRFLDYTDRKVILILKEDGTTIEVPLEEPEDSKKKGRKATRGKPKHCASCGMRIATGIAAGRTQCASCKPAVTAEGFFAAVQKAELKKKASK